MQFHEKLKMKRIELNYTQTEIAEKLGTRQQQIYKYEAGTQEPTVSRLKELCIVYGTSADYLLDLNIRN